jgi:hypothetical protein
VSFSSLLVGVAIGAVGAFGTGFLKKAGEGLYLWLTNKLWSKPAKSAQVVIHLDNQDHATEQLVPSAIEHISGITFKEIQKAIDDAPPMQRERVAEAYEGINVEWDSYFRDGHSEDDLIRVRLSADERYAGRTIICDVSAKDYRHLGVLPEGSKIRVAGQISKAHSYQIELTDVRLQVLPRPTQT